MIDLVPSPTHHDTRKLNFNKFYAFSSLFICCRATSWMTFFQPRKDPAVREESREHFFLIKMSGPTYLMLHARIFQPTLSFFYAFYASYLSS